MTPEAARATFRRMLGFVYLVGAGPGDPGLCTLRGAELLERADVVVADRLAASALLARAPAGAEIVVRGARRGELDQAAINDLLIERARAGKVVVRLKGGDPFLFGRGGEEAEALRFAGIPFEVVPGVTAAMAAPAYAGIPLTHRGVAASVIFATGHEADGKAMGQVAFSALADPSATVVLYMSVTHLGESMRRLIEAGRAPETPVALIEDGTLPGQRTVIGTIADIAERALEEGVKPPALTVVGEVVRLRERLSWFEARPLRGQRILCLSTRALTENHPGDGVRIGSLEGQGIEVEWVSPLRVVVRSDLLAEALAQITHFRWIALTSRHAATALATALTEAGLDGRALAGVRIACLEGAAETLRQLTRLLPDRIVQGGGEDLARALIAVENRGPVLFPRAADGRDELPQTLRGKGLEVEVVTAYETLVADAAIARALEIHRRLPFAAIAFGSPRGAIALLDAGLSLAGVLVGAIGATTAAALAERGVAVAVTAPVPKAVALLQMLAAELARRGKIR